MRSCRFCVVPHGARKPRALGSCHCRLLRGGRGWWSQLTSCAEAPRSTYTDAGRTVTVIAPPGIGVGRGSGVAGAGAGGGAAETAGPVVVAARGPAATTGEGTGASVPPQAKMPAARPENRWHLDIATDASTDAVVDPPVLRGTPAGTIRLDGADGAEQLHARWVHGMRSQVGRLSLIAAHSSTCLSFDQSVAASTQSSCACVKPSF